MSSVLPIRSSASVSLPEYELKSVLISDMAAKSLSFRVVTTALRKLIAASMSRVSVLAEVALASLALASSILSLACLVSGGLFRSSVVFFFWWHNSLPFETA